MFDFNAAGISMDAPILPDGFYTLRIMEATEQTTKSGHPMVKVRAEVSGDAVYAGWTVFHYVTFLPKESPGAGMALNFLKAIQQPYEGEIKVNADEWVGKVFDAQIIADEYQGRKSNKIKKVIPVKPPISGIPDSGIPF